jgi:DNA adenine methylase
MLDPSIPRPALRYYGAKWLLAPWILSHLPPHHCWVDAFGGSCALTLRKQRVAAEIYNDLDGEVVAFFRVLREREQELVRAIRLTPFARAEFEMAMSAGAELDEVERARRTYVRAWMGFGAGLRPNRTGWRYCRGVGRASSGAQEFAATEHLHQVAERLRGVQIECSPAMEVLRRFDGVDTLHYLDPPYLRSSRSHRWGADGYRHEMSDDEHEALLSAACELRGMVAISGYRSGLYDEALLSQGWGRLDREARTSGGRAVESLWLNPAAQQRQRQRRLLEVSA